VDMSSHLATTVLPGHYSLPCEALSHCSYLFEMILSHSHIHTIASELLSHVSKHASRVVLLSSGNHNSEESSSIGHFLLLVGDDFSARKANIMFHNLDLIMEEFNHLQQGKKEETSLYSFAAEYSTPHRYFGAYAHHIREPKASNDDLSSKQKLLRKSMDAPLSSSSSSSSSSLSSGPSFATAAGDSLPYSDNIVNDWTGYYGSRPALKHQIRCDCHHPINHRFKS
jgi:hypothetical protein